MAKYAFDNYFQIDNFIDSKKSEENYYHIKLKLKFRSEFN